MRKFKFPIRSILFTVCLAVLCICGGTGLKEVWPYVRERAVNRQLAAQVQRARTEAEAEGDSKTAADSGAGTDGDIVRTAGKSCGAGGSMEPLPQYEEAYRQNPDLAGWLQIEETGIDYPVMYTPKDPEYYLHRDFYGRPAYGGCLFIGEGYDIQGGNTIIYGHHMKDRTMFAGLLSYENQEFADSHPSIRFDTVFEEGMYQVAAAFYCDLEEEEDAAFDYYRYPDLSDRQLFDNYTGRVKERNLIDTGVEFRYGDRLITLSTCSYHVKNGRFVVIARQY